MTDLDKIYDKRFRFVVTENGCQKVCTSTNTS